MVKEAEEICKLRFGRIRGHPWKEAREGHVSVEKS